jgi:membrane protein
MTNRTETENDGPSLWAAIGVATIAMWVFLRTPSSPATPDAEQPTQVAGGHPPEGESSRPLTSSAKAGTEPDRGRLADHPSKITAKGWKDILWRIFEDVSTHRLMAVAAGVTFYVLLAIFPAVAALVSLYGLFADPATISDQLNGMANVLPGGAIDIIGDQVKRIAAKPHGSLSFGFVTGLLIALWSANAGIKAMFDALNIVYDETESRSFIRLNAVSLTFTLGAIVTLLLILGSVVVLPVVLGYIHLDTKIEQSLTWGRWPILLLATITVFALLYRFGPARVQARWRWITWGSVFSATAWIGGSALFSWYVSSFGNYNATYGSLGAVIGFMTWIWISIVIVLIGGEFNAEMELQTKRDTTIGPEKPIGTRGADVADKIGQAAA